MNATSSASGTSTSGPRGGPGTSFLRAATCALLMVAVAAIGGAVTSSQIPTWYATLPKPSFTPPNAVFPVAWTILYFMMGICLWRLWDRAPDSPARRPAIALFLVQLALNFAWSPVFFALHAVWAAFAIIVVLILVLAATMRFAFRADALAGWLLVPYLLWVCFASLLNGSIAFALG
ncbi:TspO/MBR family protein [Aquabacter sediminis]|uniref:TspO/MBR family protein n=1 Tax=Aquabacter sediminis TaxID=3029197 RepID=UPI0031594400